MATSRLSTRRIEWRVQVGTSRKPAQGLVIFEASVSYIPDPLASGGPRTVVPEPVLAVIDTNGYICTPDPNDLARAGERGVVLDTTDSLSEKGGEWTWVAKPQLRSVNGVQMIDAIPPFGFVLPAGTDTVNLADVQKLPASPGLGSEQAIAWTMAAEKAAKDARQAADEVVKRANAGEFQGEQGIPGVNAVPASEAVAVYAATPGNPVNSALISQFAPGFTVMPGANSGTQVQNAIKTLIGPLGVGGGDIVLAAGTHIWDMTPKIPRSLLSNLTIRGDGGATIKLTSTGKRAFDLDWTAADQTFRNFTLSDFNVDATASTGRNHIIVGNYVNGSFVGRFNLENIAVRRINSYGAKADPTTVNHPTHIHLTPRHETSGEAENRLINIHVADLDLDGGNTGVVIGGNGPNSGIEVYCDNITIERTRFKGGDVPKVFYTTSGFHVGGKGHCGRIVLRDLVSQNSGDNGFEVNAPRDALLDNCLSIDAANVGHYSRNFHPLVDPGHSRIEWRHCRVWIRDFIPDASKGLLGRGFMVGGQNPFGRLLLTGGCEHQVDSPGDFSEISSFAIQSVGVAEIDFEAFKSRVNNVNVAPSRAYFPTPISLSPGSPCVIRGTFSIEAHGKRTGGTEMFYRALAIGGPDTTVDLAGTFNVDLGGFEPHTVYGFDLGEREGSKVGGRLYAVIQGGVVGRGARLRPGLTVDKSLLISGDYSGMVDGGIEVFGTTEAAAGNVNLGPGTVFKKSPGAPTRTVTSSPFTYKNVSMYPELVSVRIDGRTPGSAPISRISCSKRGGSAIDTGAVAGQFYLQNGDSLTVEYGQGQYPPVIRSQCALPSA